MRLLPLALLVLGCDYDAPVLGDHPQPANVIAGQVIANDVEEPADVILLLFAADAPPPPAGTGRPLTFTSVPASDFTRSGSGVLSARYALGNVPDGEYLVTGLMDMDANFHPLVSALAGATCGDVLGAHLADLATGELGVVSVSGGKLADNVTVVLGRHNQIERPAFYIGQGGTVSREAALTGATQELRLRSTGVQSPILTINGPGAEECPSLIAAMGVDTDGEGFDPHPDYPPETGLLDIWPRIYVQYLGVPVPQDDGSVIFEHDMEEGESYAGQLVPHPAHAMLGQIHANELSFLDELRAVWIPGVRHFLPDGGEEIIANPLEIPGGAWSITMIGPTGATWPLPNELAFYPASGPDFDPEKQGAFLMVE